MPPEMTRQEGVGRLTILSGLTSNLKFFGLLVLVGEAVFGAVAWRATGINQLLALSAMLAIIILLIIVVSFFALRKPYALQFPEMQEREDFISRIVGNWLQQIDSSAISAMEINHHRATLSVKIDGTGWDKGGKRKASWKTIATCINWDERTVFYYWQGNWESRATSKRGQIRNGFGELTFSQSDGPMDHAEGTYSDGKLADRTSTQKRTFELCRCTKDELAIVRRGNRSAIDELIREKFG